MIPDRYIKQCNILLDFYEATMLDSVLIAELLLYWTFHQKVNQGAHLQENGECNEIDEWKEKWAHVFGKSIERESNQSYVLLETYLTALSTT